MTTATIRRAAVGEPRPPSASPALPWWRRRTGVAPLRAIVGLAFVVRLAVFPFADNKHADAPIRAMIAERMNADPKAAADPRTFCQFGPLPIEIMRPFLALDRDAPRSSRVPSFIAGVAVFVPFFALAERMVGVGPAVALAGLALALSPLHIQVSTTAASEAIYLLVLLSAFVRMHDAVERRRRRDFVVAGLLASLAAITRYDTWLGLPVAGAAMLIFGPRDRRALVDVALFLGVSAIFPVAYLSWSFVNSGDPFFFARYITRDHAAMAAAISLKLGPGLARLRQVGIWLASFAGAMTPVAVLGLGRAAVGWRRWSAGTRVVVATVLAPPAAYIVQGLVFGAFEPLPRFAIAPGAALLPLACAALGGVGAGWPRAWRPAAIAGGALAMAAIALAFAFARPGRIWAGAESMGPLTRLDAEDRTLARAIRARRRVGEGVFIDTLGFVDIAIAHAAGVPAPLTATLAITRAPPSTLAAGRAETGASWFAIHDDSWGKNRIPDWPADAERFGHWRLARFDGARVVTGR